MSGLARKNAVDGCHYPAADCSQLSHGRARTNAQLALHPTKTLPVIVSACMHSETTSLANPLPLRPGTGLEEDSRLPSGHVWDQSCSPSSSPICHSLAFAPAYFYACEPPGCHMNLAFTDITLTAAAAASLRGSKDCDLCWYTTRILPEEHTKISFRCWRGWRIEPIGVGFLGFYICRMLPNVCSPNCCVDDDLISQGSPATGGLTLTHWHSYQP